MNTGRYNIRPIRKFQPSKAKAIITSILEEEYSTRSYDADLVNEWSKQTIEKIITKLKEMDLENYKFIVNVMIGEQRGAGIKIGSRCYWDSDTDSSVSYVFSSNELYCIATVFGIYFY